MKRLLVLGAGSALMFTMGGVGPAQADTNSSIHKSTAAVVNEVQQVSAGGGRCAGCHRAHTAKAVKLLKQAQPGLCYSCHGSLGSVLDVVDGVDPNAQKLVLDPVTLAVITPAGNKALRGGGFQYALINGGAASKTMPATLDQYAHPASETVPVITAADITAGVSTAVTSRHQIDGTTKGTMWGNGAVSAGGLLAAGKTGVTLECGSCHDPHGNGNYRILKPIPNDAETTAVAAKAAVYAADGVTIVTPAVPAVAAVVAAPVNIPDVAQGTDRVYTTGDYWSVRDLDVPTTLNGVSTGVLAVQGTKVVDSNGVKISGNDFLPGKGTSDGYISNIAAWCTTCHTRYLAPSGAWKTPLTSGGVTDSTFTYRHRSDAGDKEGVSRPNCIQCHVSHGSNVAMTGYAVGVTAPDGQLPAPAGLASTSIRNGITSAPIGGPASGTSRLLRVDNRGTCEMCHNV